MLSTQLTLHRTRKSGHVHRCAGEQGKRPHRLMQQQSILRKNGALPFLRPDAKSQLTVRYVDGRPQSVDTVVLSTQHSPEMSDGDKMKADADASRAVRRGW